MRIFRYFGVCAVLLLVGEFLAPRAPGAAAAAAGPAASDDLPLPENVVIVFLGTLQGGPPVRTAFSTAGMSMSDFVVGEAEVNGHKQPVIGHMQAVVERMGNIYKVFFQITMQRPFVTGVRSNPTDPAGKAKIPSVSYVNIGFQNTLACALGQPVQAIDFNGMKWTITVEPPKTP